MEINSLTLFLWLILSAPLLTTYGSVIDKGLDVGVGMPINLKRFYSLTIFLTIISVLYLINWSSKLESNETNTELLQLGILIIMAFSIAWGPSFNFGASKSLALKLFAVLALLGVAIGVAVLFYVAYDEYSIDKSEENKWAVVTSSIFLFQTAFLDFLVWSFFYLK